MGSSERNETSARRGETVIACSCCATEQVAAFCFRGDEGQPDRFRNARSRQVPLLSEKYTLLDWSIILKMTLYWSCVYCPLFISNLWCFVIREWTAISQYYCRITSCQFFQLWIGINSNVTLSTGFHRKLLWRLFKSRRVSKPWRRLLLPPCLVAS